MDNVDKSRDTVHDGLTYKKKDDKLLGQCLLDMVVFLHLELGNVAPIECCLSSPHHEPQRDETDANAIDEPHFEHFEDEPHFRYADRAVEVS